MKRQHKVAFSTLGTNVSQKHPKKSLLSTSNTQLVEYLKERSPESKVHPFVAGKWYNFKHCIQLMIILCLIMLWFLLGMDGRQFLSLSEADFRKNADLNFYVE